MGTCLPHVRVDNISSFFSHPVIKAVPQIFGLHGYAAYVLKFRDRKPKREALISGALLSCSKAYATLINVFSEKALPKNPMENLPSFVSSASKLFQLADRKRIYGIPCALAMISPLLFILMGVSGG